MTSLSTSLKIRAKVKKPDRDVSVILAIANDFECGRCNFMRLMTREERDSLMRRLRRIANRLQKETK